ncbi:MAG: hypothetical protein WC789_02765 [Lentisphaeria bacterium]|jgi:hypothetical protein
MNIKNPSWVKVSVAWALLGAAILLVYGHIMSGYSGTVPIIGVVPGPPSPAVNRAVGIALCACLLGIAAMSIPVLIAGSWLKRIVCAIPFLAGVLFVVIMVYSCYN